ncbi:MAG: hypothetical protein KC493_00505 [Bacteriovoracaceae bacterium]|nr:hypothetical protein [Bacteriovoracaceae bacterium]
MSRCLILFLLFSSFSVQGKMVKKIEKVMYYKYMFGHLHQNPSKYSTSLTTIGCAHPLRVYSVKTSGSKPRMVFNKEWYFVKAGPYEGYIRSQQLSRRKPKCFQDKYPKFVDQFDMEISDMYNWGRLYDLYLFKRTRVR